MGTDVDRIANVPHAPELYAYASVLEPLPTWANVTPAIRQQYAALGFLSVAHAFTPDEVAAVNAWLFDVVREGPPDGVELQYEYAAADRLDQADAEARLDMVRKLMRFADTDPRPAAMAFHPQVLKVVGELLGAEPELFQDMALLKPPGLGREKPWHQDHAYFNLPQGTSVVGVWIALDDATPENGCMHFLPGRHCAGPLPHYNRRDWQICDTDILGDDTIMAAPLPAGGCLIFDGMTPHGTPANRSTARRRAVQFHYVPLGTPRITTEERLRLFGSEGGDATC